MCKCTEQTGFKIALREALAVTTETLKLAVWENKENNKIYSGSVKDAEKRLKSGKIECYFIPKMEKDKVSFKIMEKAAEEKKAEKPKEFVKATKPEPDKSDKK